MPKFKTIINIFVFILIVFTGYHLRIKNYSQIPLPGQSMDEYSNSWVGLSLIRLGYPVGMSGMLGYGGNDTRYINVDRVFQSTANGNPFYLNYPWFDHPPLMGLVTGGYAYLKGARVFEDTVASVIRKPVIGLSILTLVLTIILGYVLYDKKTALTAGLLYATIPLFVIQSRFVQAENGMVVFFILSLILLSLFVRKQKYHYLFFSAIFAGIGTLFKLSGISAYLSAITIILLQTKPRPVLIREVFFYLAIALPITSLFVIYGAVLGWSTFTNVLSDNSSRFYGLGMAAIQNLWLETRVTHGKTLTDHWPMVFWFAFFLYLQSKRKLEELIVPVGIITYLVTYLFFGSWPYGWYTIPFWPLLTLVFSRFLLTPHKSNFHLFISSLLLIIPITQTLTRFIDIRSFQSFANPWRLFITLFITATFFVSARFASKITKYSHLWIFGLLIVAVYLNIRFLNLINPDLWLKLN